MSKVGSSRYTRDHTSHLTAVSGFRVLPRGSAGPLKIAKIQAYQTDKTITAEPNSGRGHHAKHVTLTELIDKNNPLFLEKLLNLYTSAAETGVQSHARIEVRVPFSSNGLVFNEYSTIRLRLSDTLGFS